MRCTTPWACASTRCRSRRRRCSPPSTGVIAGRRCRPSTIPRPSASRRWRRRRQRPRPTRIRRCGHEDLLVLRLPPFRYAAPGTAGDAARLLADHGPEAMAVAGGTDLYPNMKRRQFTPRVLVGLRGLEEAYGIEANGALDLGAMATLTEVANHPVVRGRWPAIARAASLVSSPPL